MENAQTLAARLPALAVELTRCTDELLACIDREEMESFTNLLDRRRLLMDELRAAVTSSPAPETGWRTMFADVLESEARLTARVEAEHRRLAGELQEVGQARTNFSRIAETYMEPDV
jgi:hypothetical protein